MKTFLFFLTLSLTYSTSFASSRLKDLVTVKGVRENPIIGYGLVIGLNGTGDGGGEITVSSLKRMFQKLGLNPKQEIASKNVAAVIVTATMLPFARVGQKLDIKVSSIGNAASLAGGTLLVTPLKGGDGQVYAIASGSVSIGGLTQGSRFPTTGLVTDGAIVEKEIALDFHKKKSIRFTLKNPDFTTAARIQRIMNENLGGKFASAKDSSTIDLIIPTNYQRSVIELMAIVENFKVITDQKAQVIINERTGTIVAGGAINLKEVAISHGNLNVEVGGGEGGEGGGGKKRPTSIHHLPDGTTINDLVKALNALGAGPEDLISIFRALKRNNAIVAEIKFI